MAELNNLTPPPRKVMTMFYIVDTSGSMAGRKIETVNSALENTKAQLDDISKNNDDAEIKIAMLTFDYEPTWQTPKPVKASDFHANLNATEYGLTNLGKACIELESKLSRSEFLETKAGAYPPVIILLSDGDPTDNYASGLEKLKHNNWYKRAIKVAFAIGADANKKVLSEFTGSTETVIEVNNAKVLSEFLKNVSVITSEFQSRSTNVGETTDSVKQSEELVKETFNTTTIDMDTVDDAKSDDDIFGGW